MKQDLFTSPTSHSFRGDSELPVADNLDIETFAAICKALGHPTRVRIVQYLKQLDRCVCGRIVELLPLAQSTVSQHLKQL